MGPFPRPGGDCQYRTIRQPLTISTQCLPRPDLLEIIDMRATHILAALAMLWLTACVPFTALPGTPQAFEEACSSPNEGVPIAVEGYLRLPPSLENTGSVILELFPDLSFEGKPIAVPVAFGDGPNQAHRVATAYRDDDLRVHLADGTEVPFGTRVRVSGRMYYVVTSEEFACGLENPYIEKIK